MTAEQEVLFAASQGKLSRYRERGRWVYQMNRKRVSRKPVLALLRRGLLEPTGLGPPYEISQGLGITVKGREALR